MTYYMPIEGRVEAVRVLDPFAFCDCKHVSALTGDFCGCLRDIRPLLCHPCRPLLHCCQMGV